MAETAQIKQAVRYLASICDYTQTKDGCGFNSADAGFGHSLADQDRWSEKQAKAAQKMLRKYKRQLEGGGFVIKTLFEGEPTGDPIPQTPKETPCQKRQTPPQKTAHLIEENLIRIQFPFDYNTVDVVKSIPGRRFNNKQEKYWTAPPSADAIEILQKDGFVLDPELLSLLERYKTSVDDVEEMEVPGLKRELFPFQRKGVAFLEAKGGRGLIGDEMGLGKTIQALAWLHIHPEKRPVVIVCPAHLKLNWVQEIRITMPENQANRTQILQGTKPTERIMGDFIIINYDILQYWVDILVSIKPQVMIFDEAHYTKNSKALRTKATKKLAKACKHVIALTGTPIVNRPIEGFNICQMVDKSVFPDFWKFARTYCGAKHNGFGWDFTGAENKDELHRKLTQSIMIRRKKDEVLPDLPAKIYSHVPMEITNRTEYKKVEDDFITYLRQAKGDEEADRAGKAQHLTRIEALKQLAVKGKMTQAIDWIQDFLDSCNGGSKLVVFAVHKSTIDTLMAEFSKVAVKVDGSVSGEKRNEAVNAFQNNPAVKLFIGNIQAAGTGLTLTAASSVAFLELPWTPGEVVQAEDRCHRIGQENSVNVYYLLAQNTIEGQIAKLLDSKREVLDAVLDGREVEETQLLAELMKAYEKEEGNAGA